MAGVSTKDIKQRIRSMESTRQITRAMEMVAASKLRHAQDRIRDSRPYFEILYGTIAHIACTRPDFSSPYLTRREGKRAVEHFRGRGVPLVTQAYSEAADVTIGDCFSLSKQLAKAYLAGEFDEISVAFTNFVSVLSQTPAILPLLPLSLTAASRQEPEEAAALYEPDPQTVFDAIIPEYLGGVVYGALCESVASELAARRTAMDAATKNADEMIGNLNLQFNRARQGAITQEITEIVAGAEA